MSDDLYDADILVWSEQQADLLRRAAHGERVNGLDWPNLIEEIEAVGRSQLNAVKSLLRQALIHMLKLTGWPECSAVEHWRLEASVFLANAAGEFTPAMRQRIDIEDIYADALRLVEAATIDGTRPCKLPQTCPFALDEMLTRRPNLAELSARLTAPQA